MKPYEAEVGANLRCIWLEFANCYASIVANFLLSFLFGQIADYKSQIFANLRGKAQKVLEIGIGAGPNLKYYGDEGMRVYGMDPNKKMEKYAREAALNAGLPPENFEFKQAVCHFINSAVRYWTSLNYCMAYVIE